MAGAAVLQEAALWHLARETRRLSWALKIYLVQAPVLEGKSARGQA